MIADATTQTFKRALGEILARVFVSAPPSLAVAYSGGLDSSVLLHLVRDYAAANGVRLFAFHVHHGLSPNADGWFAHCRDACALLGIDFDARRVQVDRESGIGLEAAARHARYAALGEMCRVHRAPLLLTAHHQDDQVETVLLQMLRGAGLAGMSGMDEVNVAPELLGDPDIHIARPLLSVARADLQSFADEAGIAHIEDESNRNLHHPRNALRKDVLPLLAAHFPAYGDCLARGAQHARAAQRLLDELAAQDLAQSAEGRHLDAAILKDFSDDRIANLLRHWLSTHGVRPPSAAWLREARAQLLDAREDAQACVALGGVASGGAESGGIQLRRYRNRIVLVRATDLPDVEPILFRWHGETSIAFPAFGGTLHFEPAESGFEPDWLQQQALSLRQRTGGGRLKLATNRPTRSLKDHYQAMGIPAWERERLPLLYAANTLLFAAGVGQDCRPSQSAAGIRLRWEAAEDKLP